MKNIPIVVLAYFQFKNNQPKEIKITHTDVINFAIKMKSRIKNDSSFQEEIIEIENQLAKAEMEGDKHKIKDFKKLLESMKYSINKFFA